MDELIISYKHMNDWYVGEIHRYFHKKFEEKYKNIKFTFIENNEIKSKYNIGDFESNFPSIFNQYNFLLINPKNNAAYVNSLNDFAPFCLYPNRGTEIFDVKKFTFCSNFNDDILEPIRKFNPEPSFYILENFSDLERIKKFRHKKRKYNKAYFLGLMYGSRNTYKNILSDSMYFEILSRRDEGNHKEKEEYFDTISDYSMSFNVDGAAKICHRDVESIGVGNLLVRETLEIKTYDPLIPNVHYLEIINSSEKKLLSDHDETTRIYYKKLIEDRLSDVMSDSKRMNEIIHEGVNWFDKNCTPESQFNLVDSFTQNLNLLL